MYTEEDLSSAIEAGILSKEAVETFRAHIAKRKCAMPADEEPFRLITGFNDIFVVIACLLLLVSVAWIGAASAPWIGAISVSVTAWCLAEFFVRKRRMALPAIILSLAFVGGILTIGLLLSDTPRRDHVGTLAVTSALAALAAWIHWLRFHVPITIASGVAAGLACGITLAATVIPDVKHWISMILFAAGLAVFALALKWDATDTVRQNWRSDVAFWLHLLAAPFLVHPLFTSLGVFQGQTTNGQAVAVVGSYIAIALIALCIDRKALMVSALIYVLYAFSTLLKQHGVVSLNFAIAALAIGSALLLLSACWRPSRRLALKLLPLAVQARFAPLR
jgi:hypothetical protein